MLIMLAGNSITYHEFLYKSYIDFCTYIHFKSVGFHTLRWFLRESVPDRAFFVSERNFVSKHFVDSTVSPLLCLPSYVTQNFLIHNTDFHPLPFWYTQVQLSWDFNWIQEIAVDTY